MVFWGKSSSKENRTFSGPILRRRRMLKLTRRAARLVRGNERLSSPRRQTLLAAFVEKDRERESETRWSNRSSYVVDVVLRMRRQ